MSACSVQSRKNKMLKDEVIEIETTLFTACNLKCSFCFENINGVRGIDIDYIKSLPDKVEKVCTPMLKNRPDCHRFRHMMWGGELFYDTIPDSMFGLYDWLMDEIEARIHKVRPDVRYETLFTSNGVWTKRDRVWKLMQKHHSGISFSYDPIERFSTPAQKETWYQTYRYFNERLPMVTVTLAMSKRNMEAYMAGDEYLEKIQKYAILDPNLYEVGEDWETDDNCPSNEDYFRFFKWCLDTEHYSLIDGGHNLNLSLPERGKRTDFNIACVPLRFAKWIEETYGRLCIPACMETSPHLPKKALDGGIHYLIDKDVPIDLCALVLRAGVDRGCYACEYFNRCELMPCPAMERDRTVANCFNRRFYQYAESHQKKLEGFKRWHKELLKRLEEKRERLRSRS